MRVGIADHFGWAVAVAANAGHDVVDRRRLELVEPGTANAPFHHEGKDLDADAFAQLLDDVRASMERATAAALHGLAADLPRPVRSVSLRVIPANFPTDLDVLRRVPWEARADAVLYREVLAAAARTRGWTVHFYDAKTAEAEAAARLGGRAEAVLHGPRAALGPPWTKDHRTALAATVLAD
jgi:hypothetical protein